MNTVNAVTCDKCFKDYSNTKTTGGFIVKAPESFDRVIGPCCALRVEEEIMQSGTTVLIRHPEDDEPFAAFVLRSRNPSPSSVESNGENDRNSG